MTHHAKKSLFFLGLLALAAILPACRTHRITADLVFFPSPPARARVLHLKSFNRLYDLAPRPTNTRSPFRGPSMGPFVLRPAGLDYRDGNLYVCDALGGVVHVWNLETGSGDTLGDTSSIRLSKPVAVAVDSDGTVFVADTNRGEVVSFDKFGKSVNRMVASDSGNSYRPVDVAISESELFVADISKHRIDVFAKEGGPWLRSIGKIGSIPGQFYFPMGIDLSPDEDLFVSDSMNSRIQVFDRNGAIGSSFGQPGNRYGDLGKPRHLAIGPDGNIFVTDAQFARIHVFDAQRRLLIMVGHEDGRTGASPLPVGVTIAKTLPAAIVTALVPDDFSARYFFFVSNSIGTKRISLYAVGEGN